MVSLPNPFIPTEATIKKVKTETTEVSTFSLAFNDRQAHEAFEHGPGQYNMVSLPGIGEAPISISSSPQRRESFDHTIRFVGRVTNLWRQLGVGDSLGIRGPFGKPWPHEQLPGKHVVVIAGGTGIAPVKPVIDTVMEDRGAVKSMTILYGAKNARELVFADQFDGWTSRGAQIHLSVDQGRTLDWPFHVGVVTTLFDRLKTPPDDSIVLMSGPEIMMRFCVLDLLNRGFSGANIYISLERRMECGVRMCGHCQTGPKYVCQDGPVFSYDEIQHIFGVVA